ncbi:hypothetical protein ATY78_13535 [Rhizobium sp. R635]|uniref:hypothetical protein n=1 Tax=Rhizobium sp. R635 TaxID=1764275 RepID=UPI000B534184|nr:hypothetical protein [Rhizobium sp. R635]OWV78199.1 hypothetical protein ATY78_13535 [Rhizobium sp. R635]
MFETAFTLTRGEEDIDLLVEYSLTPYHPGNRHAPPEFCTPPSGGEVERLTALLDGVPLDLTDAEYRLIERHIEETHDLFLAA